jgi:N-acetyl-anhydromuramyl-L-alanine amidase AmpD
VTFLGRWWKHLVAGHAAAIAIGLCLFFVVFNATPQLVKIFGQQLDRNGQTAYHAAEVHHTEFGQKLLERFALPKTKAAKVTARNNRLAAALAHPHPLASPQPTTFTALVRNHSTRQGTRPLLWVVHDAEMPNLPKLASLHAIAAWFNNPAVQASSNYATDAWGNTVLMVPTTAKAWHVAFFNPWAIGDELIGYASQKSWPVAQLRAAAELAARDDLKYGIPIQHGKVAGCTIVRPGIVRHADLGGCGGGHHDPGTGFPLPRFIALVKQYADALRTPKSKTKPAAKPKPARRCKVNDVQYALNTRAHARPQLAVDGVPGPKTRAALKRAGGVAKLGLHCRWSA